jgi:hypothetical protein
MVAVACCPVSHPRSSNRTCGSPASGFPTGFTLRHTPCRIFPRSGQNNSKFAEYPFRRKLLDASRTHLMPTDQESSHAVVNVALHSTIRNLRRAVTEIGTPAPQYGIQPVSHIRPCSPSHWASVWPLPSVSAVSNLPLMDWRLCTMSHSSETICDQRYNPGNQNRRCKRL